MTVPGVGTLMGPIEEALREKFFPTLFGGEEINTDFRKALGHSVKHGGLCIPDPRMSAESAYNTSKADSGELVDYLLGGSVLNYVGHRACVHKASLMARRTKMSLDMGEVFRRKHLVGGQERNRLHRATRNGSWLSAIPHRLNATDLSWEEFWDNLHLRYGLMPQYIPATSDSYGKKFSIENNQSCPNGGLVLERQDDAAKEWGSIGARALIPSAIIYEPKIDSRTVQEERTEAGAQQEGGEYDGGADTVGEAHGGRERTVNGADRLLGQPGQVVSNHSWRMGR